MESSPSPPSLIVEKNGVQISRILVGTSPFIAAGQFEKSHLYYLKFVLRRGGAAEILSWCLRRGFSWIQALDVDFLAREIEDARRSSSVDPTIILSTWNDPLKAVKRFKSLNVGAVLAHASIADRLEASKLKSFLSKVEKLGLTPGIATHNPLRTLPRVKHLDDVKIVMAPLNHAGLFNEDVEETLRIIKDMKAVVIAKKVLGAGRLSVKEALSWAFNRSEIDSVAIGVASLNEAEETLSMALKMALEAYSRHT